MTDTTKLRDFVVNMIGEKPEEAEVDFHGYVTSKMQDLMNAENKPKAPTEKEEQ